MAWLRGVLCSIVWTHAEAGRRNARSLAVAPQGTVTLFNLDPDTSNEHLVWLFSKFGEVKDISESPDRASQKFITFFDIRHALAALRAMNKAEHLGKLPANLTPQLAASLSHIAIHDAPSGGEVRALPRRSRSRSLRPPRLPYLTSLAPLRHPCAAPALPATPAGPAGSAAARRLAVGLARQHHLAQSAARHLARGAARAAPARPRAARRAAGAALRPRLARAPQQTQLPHQRSARARHAAVCTRTEGP
jgi:hypothetical protein